MATEKKITRVDQGAPSPLGPNDSFVPTAESKGKANQLRLIAVVLWLAAIAAQIVAIRFLLKPPVNMTWIIILIIIDLILVVIGSMLWKKSNRLDPASEKNKFMFFMQNQLGLVVSIIAFLPLIVLILTNKNIDSKQKSILGGIAAVALVIAGITGIDFNPPSVEQYTEQTKQVESLNNGKNFVYWAKSSKVYHLYNDCYHINKVATTEIMEGTVAQARELKNITSLCTFCEKKAIKEKGLSETELPENSEKPVIPAIGSDSTQ